MLVLLLRKGIGVSKGNKLAAGTETCSYNYSKVNLEIGQIEVICSDEILRFGNLFISYD